MPDDALLASADSGKLSKDVAELDAQVGRMLEDPRSRALLDNFASQWLLHTLPNAKPDPTLFPVFDEDLRAAMAEETKAFVGSFLLGDQSLPDMMDAKFTLRERAHGDVLRHRRRHRHGLRARAGDSGVPSRRPARTRGDSHHDRHRHAHLARAAR